MSNLDTTRSESNSIFTKASGKGLRWLLAEIHLWFGLILCAPLVLLGLSGSYLMYHDEIDALLAGGPTFEVSQGVPQSVDAIIALAAATAPEGFSLRMIRMPEGAGEPVIARIGPDGASFRDPRAKSIAVDPVTLNVLGEVVGGRSLLTGIMHDIHSHALIPGGIGRPIVGWLGVIMLFLCGSGLIIWWPRPRKLWAALTIKRGARGLRLHRDLHGAVGFWTLIVFTIVSFTGVYIAFPNPVASLMETVLMQERSSPPGPPVKAADGISEMRLQDAVRLADTVVSDVDFVQALMPFRPGQPLRVQYNVPGSAEGAPKVTVMIDPWKIDITKVEDPRTFGRTDTAVAWQRPLHAGVGLGPIWNALVFISGFLPLLFSITGISMWWIKRRARQKRGRAA